MPPRKRSRRSGRRHPSKAPRVQGHGAVARAKPAPRSPAALWREVLLDALDAPCPEEAVLEAVDAAFDHLDATLAANPPPLPLECAEGCHFCCHTHVSTTPLESFAMLAHMDAAMAPEERPATRQRILALGQTLRGKTHAEIYAMRRLTACPFLQQEGCASYPARPLVCRSWHSVSRASCRLALMGDDPDAAIENYPARLDYAEQMQRGMLQALEERGIEAGLVVSTRALGRLLAGGEWRETFSAWLAGARVFSVRRN